MKGVIVQVGNPKSIVLLNNGKITAIPTPVNCQVGMLVTVKYNNTLKIIALALAAVALITLGIIIGARWRGPSNTPPADTSVYEPWHGGRGHGRGMHRR